MAKKNEIEGKWVLQIAQDSGCIFFCYQQLNLSTIIVPTQSDAWVTFDNIDGALQLITNVLGFLYFGQEERIIYELAT